MLKRILTTTFILSLLAPVTIHGEASAKPVEESKEPKALVMPWRFYARIAQCETGRDKNGKIDWHYKSRTYITGFGMTRQTFHRWSGKKTTKGMTHIDMAKIVDRVAFLGWTNPKGEYVWPVGPYGWAVIKYQNCMGLQKIVCDSRHPKVQRWKRYC
jgi:hypothetical protein